MRSLILFILLFSYTTMASENKLSCENVIKFSDYQGMTYLAFMQNIVKPTLDDYALNGYPLADASQVKAALALVSGKVRGAAKRAAGGERKLLEIAGELAGKQSTLYDLPNMIARVAPRANRYKLATFLGLVSCGGAIIEYDTQHIAYNIHYGTGAEDKDDRTGRSFGEGIVRNSDDASDKNYLKDLEEFGAHHADSMEAFYQAVIKSLANSDASDMQKISDFGKLLLTDFLAVYTAEQARNLMDNRIHIHWDAALLEVTLLGAFHAGQEEIQLFFKNPETGKTTFTKEVLHQDTGCSDKPRKVRAARVYDYWQFSSNPNPSHCRRSGINITKRSFRKLGRLITKYQLRKNPKLVRNITDIIGTGSRLNLYNQLSKFFINAKTAKSLDNAQILADHFVAFLVQVKQDAKEITRLIESGDLK